MEIEQLPRDELQILVLNKRHGLTSFESTNDDLNDFFKNDSLKDQEAQINKTYICYWKKSIVGYFSILADTIEVQAIGDHDGIEDYPYKKYPGIKIARLAVDRKFERKGIGRFLVLASIGLALSVSEIIGCRYLTVDSKQESIGFYEKLGFKIVERYRQSEFPKLYLNMYPIITGIKPKESLEGFEN